MFENILDVQGCPCGREHTLITRHFIVEPNAMQKLPQLLKTLQSHAAPLAVFDENTHKAAYAKFSAALPDTDICVLQGSEVKPNETQVEALEKALDVDAYSIVLAVGSGVICDVVRYVAGKHNLPFVAVPTAASVDGYVSDSAVMTLNGAKQSLPSRAPVAVLADLEIIAAAPKFLTAAGVGDMLSKYLSIADWRVGNLITDEYYCDFVAQMELDAVNLIVDNIDKIAAGDVESIGILMEGLLLSGLAMQMVKITRPASSFEHHFSHYLEIVPIENVNHNALHGEKVGIASIIAAKLYKTLAIATKRIYEENLPNRFDMEKVVGYYSKYPQGVVDFVIKENTPTITSKLNVDLLRKNYDKVLEAADGILPHERMYECLKAVGGYTDYHEIGLTDEQYRETMRICCYIRNRFTMLRLACDYELFDFSTL